MMVVNLLFVYCLFATCMLFGVHSQSAETTVIPAAKKSIFATSNADRVNDFINKAFGRLIDEGKLEDLYDGDFVCGSPSKFRFDTGFEIHSPYTPYHESGGFEVETLESYYAEKWENLMSSDNDWHYDAILDNSMTFWVADLSTFDEYNEDYVDRVYLSWEWDGNTYYSMFLHNAQFKGDLNQFELISDTFSHKTDAELASLPRSEPRAFFDDDIANYASYAKSNEYEMVSVGIRRAVSDIGRNIEWYKVIFGATLTNDEQIVTGEMIDANGNTVNYAHLIMDTGDGWAVSFYQRVGDKSTFGDLSIEDMENGLNKAHGEIMVNPFCCVDRWYDMHYALPLQDDIQGLSVLDSVMQSGEIYMVYYNEKVENTEDWDGENDSDEDQVGMFWTLVEPNGQMVQIPGILIDTATDTTDSGSTIRFFVDPSQWDGNWCSMDNLDEYQQFGFGEDIAYINIVDTLEDKTAREEDEQEQKDENGGNVEKNLVAGDGFVRGRLSTHNANMRFLNPSLMVLGIVIAVLILVCHRICHQVKKTSNKTMCEVEPMKRKDVSFNDGGNNNFEYRTFESNTNREYNFVL